MAKWKSAEMVGSQTTCTVYRLDESGQEVRGEVALKWNFGSPQFVGPVFRKQFHFDTDGIQTRPATETVIDTKPTY